MHSTGLCTVFHNWTRVIKRLNRSTALYCRKRLSLLRICSPQDRCQKTTFFPNNTTALVYAVLFVEIHHVCELSTKGNIKICNSARQYNIFFKSRCRNTMGLYRYRQFQTYCTHSRLCR